jgi:DNA repair protein RecN (Recombination protein N)
VLTHLTINNYAIAESLDIELHNGMTVITGETGAGKSIMLDALGLALGDRADANALRPGAEKAEISASFDISAIKNARQWLAERELEQDNDCLLRRVISKDGRSRAFINGQPATLQDLRSLGDLLVDIYSQNAHQSLLDKQQQRALLDAFAGAANLADDVRHIAQRYQQSQQELQKIIRNRDEQSARAELLRYQLEELDQLNLSSDELSKLEAEQKQLANGENLMNACQLAIALCEGGDDQVSNPVTRQLQQALKALTQQDSPDLRDSIYMLDSALIQVQEAAGNIQDFLDRFDLNPERLLFIEQRLGAIYEMARKHRIHASQLHELQNELQNELNGYSGGDQRINELQAECEKLEKDYRSKAAQLSKSRQTAAGKLEKAVAGQLKLLSMNGCKFVVAITQREHSAPHANGLEDIEFLISTNPAAAPNSLAKVASGGELSRIGLAIQVITVQTSSIPTLVFDEVDVGIGGATAAVVGKLLRELGSKGQVICVTHQPQVASQGHQHFNVRKIVDKKSARTEMVVLNGEEKVEEIARMLGGLEITEQTRAHAKEMLAL